MNDSAVSQAALGPVPAPTRLRYLFGTWSGRILLVNTLVFIALCVVTKSLLEPSTEAVIAFGAKDPVRLASGEVWRLLTPIFIHIGILHFAFNSYFLYAVGYQLERLLGAAWFVTCYVVAGIMGNLASAAFSVNMSAGASSSLFGLLGAGLFIEWVVGSRIKRETGRRPRQRAYLMTVALNLGFGLLMPFIDNSAHLGGLFAGLCLTGAMLNLRPNQLQRRRPLVGVLFVLCLVVGGGWCAYQSLLPQLVAARLVHAAQRAKEPDEQVYRLTQALALEPSSGTTLLLRVKALYSLSEPAYALRDAQTLLERHEMRAGLAEVASDLERTQHSSEAADLRRLLLHYGGESL